MFGNSKGLAEVIILLLVVVGATFIVGGLGSNKKNLPASTPTAVTPDFSTLNQTNLKSLQLKSFGFNLPTLPPATPPPTDSPTSPPVSTPPPTPPIAGTPPPTTCQGTARYCECQDPYGAGPNGPTDGHRIVCPDPLNQVTITYCMDVLNARDSTCLMTPDLSAKGCTDSCVDKPVIYLYPEKPTNVSVKVKTTGKVVVSDPLYPEETGWENVLAFPNGSLIYKNKVYSELFYETSVNDIRAPKDGIVVESKNIEKELNALVTQLGLINHEKMELLDYWVPRLEGLNKKYILVSLIDSATKEKIDKLLITPEPDTRIEFLLYFRGLDEKMNIPKLNVPKAPERRGFVEVEWGGTISN